MAASSDSQAALAWCEPSVCRVSVALCVVLNSLLIVLASFAVLLLCAVVSPDGQRAAFADEPAEAVTFAVADATVSPGESIAVLAFKEGRRIDPTAVVLRSGDPRTVGVDDRGDVYGLRMGSATVTASTDAGDSCTFTVRVGFSDVSADAWFAETVDAIADLGVMTGYASTLSFGPYDTMTRGQAVLVLHRFAGVADDGAANEDGSVATPSFSDVPASHYAHDAVMWAAACGIVGGYAGTDRFGVNDAVTREQLCVMIHRLARRLGAVPVADEPVELDFGAYSDGASVSGFAREAVAWGVGAGIVGGSSALLPTKATARCEAAKMMLTAYHLLLSKRVVPAFSSPRDLDAMAVSAPSVPVKIGPTSGCYEITCARTPTFGLDVVGASQAAGARIQLWRKNSSMAQRFTLSDAGDGTVRIDAVVSKLVLTASDGGVVQEPWRGMATQRWVPVTVASGTMLVNAADGRALEYSREDENGAPVLAFAAAQWGGSQSFTLRATSPYTVADVRNILARAHTSRAIEGFGGYAPSLQARKILEVALAGVSRWGGNVGVVVVDLTTGRGMTYNADTPFYAASTIKGSYVAAVCAQRLAALGAWRTTMRQTIAISSNEGYMALRRAFGMTPMVQWCREAGVPTALATPNYPRYSARQLAQLWTRNYEFFADGGAVAAEVGTWYASPYNSTIHAALGSRYATKTKPGWIGNARARATSDAGIVYAGDHPYIMVMLTDLPANLIPLKPLATALDVVHAEMVR